MNTKHITAIFTVIMLTVLCASAYVSVPTITDGIGFQYENITIGDNRIQIGDTNITNTATVVVAASDSLNKAAADVICDNVDALSIIQSVIDTAADGEHIHFMEGNYPISDYPLVSGRDRLTITGSGWGTIFTNTGQGHAIFRIYNSTNIIVRDIWFHVTDMATTGLRVGFSLSESSNCLIDHIALEGTFPGGDHLTAVPLQGIVIDDGDYLDNGKESHDNIFTHCYATKCRYEGFSVYGHDSYRNTFVDCIAKTNGIFGYVIERHSHDNTIMNCFTSDVRSADGGGIYLLDACDNIVEGNTITDGLGYGINIRHLSRRNNIANNNIRNVSREGIKVASVETTNNLIHGNTITLTGIDGIWDRDGISNIYTNNHIISPGLSGIRVENWGAEIRNNVIQYCRREHHGIYLYSGTHAQHDIIIADNTITGCYRGIRLYAHTNAMSRITIERNRLDDDADKVATTLTTAATAGDTSIAVAHTAGMILGMRITLGAETKRIVGFHSVGYVTTPITVLLDSALAGNHINGAAVTGGTNSGRGLNAEAASGGSFGDVWVRNNVFDASVPTAISPVQAFDYQNNRGFITENSGTDTITTDAKVVAHGLDVTPVAGDILVTMLADVSPATRPPWIDTYTDSSFTLHLDQAPTVPALFAFTAAKV